jgi:dTDP-N-acetylfucosamine:lipid II N-acetylfucosaminyltransferase
MLNVVHIYTDITFLIESEFYNKDFFSNTIFLISENIPYEKVSSFHPIIVSGTEVDLKKVVTICSTADLVILYELDLIKSFIALKIARNVTIAWRFFGAELYGKNVTNYLSKSSLKVFNIKKEKFSKFFNYKIIYGKLESIIRNRYFIGDHFAEAIERIDLFMCLSEQEYNHLSHFWKNLPPFVQIPTNFKFPQRSTNAKTDMVIIGNSRSIFNNHIDIIDLIENVHCSDQLHFLIPFSYGVEMNYTREIRQRVKNSQKRIELLENFMSYESYFTLVSKAKAAVFNGFRQMAMGNVCESINSGTKVYLNTHNIIYQWFRSFGVQIFTIEEFASDLESDNLELDSEDKEKNIFALNHMLSQFTIEQLLTEINTFIRNKEILLSESKISGKA